MNTILVTVIILADIALILIFRIFSRRIRNEIIALIGLILFETFLVFICNNELETMRSLKALVFAEFGYGSRTNMKYSSDFSELNKHVELDSQLLTGEKSGYLYTVFLPPDGQFPYRFVFVACPKQYGLTGIHSFLIDEASVIHYSWNRTSPNELRRQAQSVIEGSGTDWHPIEAFVNLMIDKNVKLRPTPNRHE